MNCPQVKEQLVAYSLGELDLVQHRAIESHLEGCPGCSAEATQMRRDLSRMTSALKTELLPPPGLLSSMESQLRAASPRPTVRWRWIAWPAFALAVVLLFAFLLRPHPRPYGALALADLPVPAMMRGESPLDAAGRLRKETGALVSPMPLGTFEGATSVAMDGAAIPVLAYTQDGRHIRCYQLPAKSLDTSGMHPMTMGGKRFFCCSHNAGSLVAMETGSGAYLFSGDMDEQSLVMLAMKSLS